jgi:hypothetical protein
VFPRNRDHVSRASNIKPGIGLASRLTIVVLCVFAVLSAALLCLWFQRGQPNEYDGSRSEQWEEAVNTFTTAFETSIRPHRTEIYPHVPDRIDALFRRNHVVVVRASITSDQDEETKENAVLYIDGPHLEIVGYLPDAINLSTDEDYVYVWFTGEKNGMRIKRNDHDLIFYVLYYLDPGWLVAGMYSAFLKDPGSADVTVSEGHKWKEIRFLDRSDVYEVIYIAESPVWFCGWRDKNDANVPETVIVSKPTSTAEIPETIRQRRRHVVFNDTEATLRDFMVFP